MKDKDRRELREHHLRRLKEALMVASGIKTIVAELEARAERGVQDIETLKGWVKKLSQLSHDDLNGRNR
jgi:hypothetical protein